MGSGEVGGFTNIAFPIVRRVFGGLIANELVSIQPMSLPSGLLFYLDYTYGSDQGPYTSGSSIYGGPAGKAIQGGALAEGGQYDLAGSGYSKVYDSTAAISFAAADGNAATRAFSVDADETVTVAVNGAAPKAAAKSGFSAKLMQFDTKALESDQALSFLLVPLSGATAAAFKDKSPELSLIKNMSLKGTIQGLTNVPASLQPGDVSQNIRRLN
jgi:hypothetical protein